MSARYEQGVILAVRQFSNAVFSAYLAAGPELQAESATICFSLQAATPVCVGKARSRMQSLQVGDYRPEGVEGRPGDQVLSFQIHGDGAFSAQVSTCKDYFVIFLLF